MALSSQMSRVGASRRYMASGRRRRRRWPWVLLVLIGLGFGLVYLMAGGGSDDIEAGEPAEARETGDGRDGPLPDGEASGSRAAMAGAGQAGQTERTSQPTRVSEMPPVPTLTFGGGDADGEGSSTRTAASSGTSEASATRPATNLSTGRTRSPRQSATSAASGVESEAIRRGMDLIAEGKLVEGRQVLSALLFDERRRLSAGDARAVRETLSSVNEKLVFSPEVVAGDPLAETYRVQSGDLLARIGPRYNLTYQFLERINGIDARRLQVGQPLKLIRGPFHARVSKSEYRMDVFLRQTDGSPIYVRSYEVGLGEDDSTPRGMWVIEPGRKVVNPDWRNPRTGEYYRSDDPDNPIGDYWLAMKGTDGNTEGQVGYGIHGTVDPDSVGQSVSMGCIRLRDGDIEQVFHLLVEGESTVEVVR